MSSTEQQSNLDFWRARLVETVASWREMFSPRTLGVDIAAGLTVACVALPLNLALAIASGVPAGAGIVTGVVGGIVAGLFGGSRLQVTGPSATMLPVLYEVVQHYGIPGLMVAGFLCGIILIGLGLARVGQVVSSLPVPVIAGFVTGVGILILDVQIPRLLGVPEHIKSVTALLRDTSWTSQVNVPGLCLGLGVLAGMFLLPKLHKRMPAALVGLGLATVIAVVAGFQLPTVGSIPRSIPAPTLPNIAGVNIVTLLPEVMAMVVLASVESLLSAVAVDSMAKIPRHSSDQELVGQGLANIASSLFGGMPVTGVIIRSSVNAQSGAQTRLATVTHSLTLLAMMLVAASYVARVPIAGLAAILLFAGWRLLAWREFLKMWKVSRFEAGIFLATMLGIVLTDFIDGVMIGLILALVHFAHTQRQLGLAVTGTLTDEPGEVARLLTPTDGRQNGGPLDVAVVRVEGPIFFASHRNLENLASTKNLPKYLIFDMAGVPLIDVTGVETFKGLIQKLAERGTAVILARVTDSVRRRLERASVLPMTVGQTVFPSVSAALAAIATHVVETEGRVVSSSVVLSGSSPVTA